MKINTNIYPYNPDPELFPIYLTGVGGTEYHGICDRPNGYQWHQILHCISGNGFLNYDGITEAINPGDYFFLPAGYPAKYYGEKSKWEVRWIAFSGYATKELLKKFDMTEPFILRGAASEVLDNLYLEMIKANKNDKMFASNICAGLVYQYLIRFHILLDGGQNKLMREKANIIIPVLTYIESNYKKDFSIELLAELAGITHQHLCRVFKETYNIKPNEFIIRRRLNEAKRLLLEDNISILDIATDLGFPNASYFSTVFKKYEGIAPNEYRKNMRKN